MGTEDKLYKKIQQVAEKAETNTFPGMEKVWARVEEKLETNVLKKEKNNWKKISVAASIIIVLSILYNFNKRESRIERDSIVINDSMVKKELLKEEQIISLVKDTVKKIKKDTLFNLKENQVVFKTSPIELVKNDSLKLQKNNLKIIPNNNALGFIETADSTSKTNKKDNILFPNLKKRNQRIEYTSFQSTSNKSLQNPRTTFKKPNPLVIINGKVDSVNGLKEITKDEIDSIYVLTNPLYIINGVEYSEESLFGKNPTSPYYPLDKQKIIATTILYKEEGEKIYGVKGKEGVVIIKTKNEKPIK
ncbi:hypothetical protein FIA58_005180 [Flavobacterium jejuense]|uniref:TonB-dependent receptor plug domain-containing protein n=1 Tax=Flavobacterium jejuense TaxID=1544455 RepID=A0ABX0IPA0_9FLAO|nr:hypothetical protein [Flavobacterium jejuense]NHN25066.1 hypothetical protein [Flavobacterium jejuense]